MAAVNWMALQAEAQLHSGKTRPNVLMILVDDLKPAIGAYGDSTAITPNLNQLTQRGLRFDLAFCNQAVCAPSRFTLMLGSHSTSTGLYGLGSQLREMIPDAVTMPQFFAKEGGYRTESLGKVFHIGHGNQGDPESFAVPHFTEKVIEYLDPASTNGGQLTREEAYFTNQKLGEIRTLPRGAAFESPDVRDDEYADGRVAHETIRRLQLAADRLKEAKAGEESAAPFFIAAGFARPHLPFSVPRRYWDLYDPSLLPMPEYEQLPVNAPAVAGKRGGEINNYAPVPADGFIDEALKRKLIHGYYASVSFVDAQIGLVIRELDRLGLAEDTIIVLWGDHGFHLGDLGIWTKHTNYEQANRIPLVFVAPGVTQPGTSTNQPAESVDVFPTLAELCQLPSPAGPQPIDGVSLVPVLRDPSLRVRNHAFHAYPHRTLGRAIRTERFRLVEWKTPGAASETAEIELYDYQLDPHETRNHADEKPDVVARLRKVLAAYPEAVDRDGRPAIPANQANRLNLGTPTIAEQIISIEAVVAAQNPNGVVVAQGGREQGYSVHFVDGRPTFDVRVGGKVSRVQSGNSVSGTIRLSAELNASQLLLVVNGASAETCSSPGLISMQPKDGLSVGLDELSAAGEYEAPNAFTGKILKVSVSTAAPGARVPESLK
ncbi:MAG: sulfatase-like hydrolase/transferase [Planctomycetaceae bacterium]|nr:sulfatase-like hydrolase/transferase [Planctomycetaceae bacterium]